MISYVHCWGFVRWSLVIRGTIVNPNGLLKNTACIFMYQLMSIMCTIRCIANCLIPCDFPDIFTVIFPFSPLLLCLSLSPELESSNFPNFPFRSLVTYYSPLHCSLIPTLHSYNILFYLPGFHSYSGCVLTSENLEPEVSDEREHVSLMVQATMRYSE